MRIAEDVRDLRVVADVVAVPLRPVCGQVVEPVTKRRRAPPRGRRHLLRVAVRRADVAVVAGRPGKGLVPAEGFRERAVPRHRLRGGGKVAARCGPPPSSAFGRYQTADLGENSVELTRLLEL